MGEQTVAVIPCTNQKSENGGPAREVWVGSHFQLVLAHTEMFFDKVLVMSYKYGLISPDFVIEPYDFDVRYAITSEKLKWWFKIRTDIKNLCADKPILVGLYTGTFERERIMREFVRNGVRQVILPFEGLTVGERMARVYDCIEPFDPEKARANEYALPENFGEADTKYLPPPTQMTDDITWE
jgi:hypothetical protein